MSAPAGNDTAKAVATAFSKMTALDWLMERTKMDLADLRLRASKELRELAERATKAAAEFDKGNDNPWDLAFLRGHADEVHNVTAKLATLKAHDAELRKVLANDRCRTCGERTQADTSEGGVL